MVGEIDDGAGGAWHKEKIIMRAGQEGKESSRNREAADKRGMIECGVGTMKCGIIL